MTQYISNHTPTANTTGWSETGDGTIQATADGLRWYSTSKGSGRRLRVKIYTQADSDVAGIGGYATKYFESSGVQVRRNLATSGLLTKSTIYGTAHPYQGETSGISSQTLSTVPLTVNQFVKLSNIKNAQAWYGFPGDGNDDVYLAFYAEDGKPFDFTFKNAKVYDTSDQPADIVLDAGDAVFTVAQPDDSLSGTFAFAGGNDEAVSMIEWNWGDGSAKQKVGATAATTHTFPTAGVYTVTATMFPPLNSETYAFGPPVVTSSQVVTVPVGDFTAKFTYQVDFPVLTVDASSSTAPIRGPVQTYAWNWGDGKVDSGVKQTHEYANAGNYTVTLTTSNSITKASSQATKVIVVGQAAQQIGAPVYEIGLFLDDPASTVGATNLQSEMVPILRASEIKHNWTEDESNALTFQAPSTWLVDALGAGATVDTLRSDIVLRFNFGTGWIEMPNCRYIVDSATADPLNPRSNVQVTCYLAACADLDGIYFTPEMINLAYSPDEIKANYSRMFTGVNPGVIGRTLLPVATTPGSGGANLPFLNVDFSSTADSKGQPWVTTLSNLTVPPEANGSGLQKTLVENGAINWYTQGNVVRWFNRGTAGRRAVGDATPTLIPGVDIASAPQTRAIASRAWGAVVVSGAKAPFIAVDTDATSESYSSAHYRGRRYIAVTSQDADSDAAALAIAKPTLTQLKRSRDGEMQRDLIFYPGMPWAPYRDYWVGDVINAPGPDGTMIATRVVGITTTKTSSDGLKVSITLGQPLALDPLASKVASMSGGSGLSVGAVGERPPSATSGYIGTLASSKVTNDTGTVKAGTTGLALEGKTSIGTADLALMGDATSALLRSMTVYNRTYSNAANVYITSSGTIGRSTSASKYKLNISEQDYGQAILDLPVKTWFDKASCEGFIGQDDADVSRQVGLIAEDLVDAGLADLVQHNWETGEVEGIQYDRVALLLIPIVRDLRDQLEARDLVLEQLLARVAALESTPTMTTSE